LHFLQVYNSTSNRSGALITLQYDPIEQDAGVCSGSPASDQADRGGISRRAATAAQAAFQAAIKPQAATMPRPGGR
jgi:hypothetical protein